MLTGTGVTASLSGPYRPLCLVVWAIGKCLAIGCGASDGMRRTPAAAWWQMCRWKLRYSRVRCLTQAPCASSPCQHAADHAPVMTASLSVRPPVAIEGEPSVGPAGNPSSVNHLQPGHPNPHQAEPASSKRPWTSMPQNSLHPLCDENSYGCMPSAVWGSIARESWEHNCFR